MKKLIWKVTYRNAYGRKQLKKFDDILEANQFSSEVQNHTDLTFVSQDWVLV